MGSVQPYADGARSIGRARGAYEVPVMTYDCSCDGEPSSIYRASTPRARKRYCCGECGTPILPGDRYENVFGIWEGSPTTFRTCEPCCDLRVWVRNNVPCLCLMHGNMDEEMSAAVYSACDRAPDETRGLKFGFLRRKVLRGRIKQLKKAVS